VNSYVKHLMELRKKTASPSEPQAPVASTPVVAKKPADGGPKIVKKSELEAKPSLVKTGDKAKTSMASISAKVVPVQQPGHASTNSYVAKLRAAKPAAHKEPRKATKHAKSAKVEAAPAKATKTSEPVKTKLDKEQTAKSKVDRKNRSAKFAEHENAVQHNEPAKAANHAEPVKGKMAKKAEPIKLEEPKKTSVPVGKLGAKAARASGLADVVSNIDAAQAAKVRKIDEVKGATKLHALRKEPTKVERKIEAAKVPEPKKKTIVEKVVAPKKAKHEEPVKAKAEKMVEPANPQEPKKAEVRKEPTKVERRVEVAKLPEPKKKAAVAVKAHDAAMSVTAPQSEKTADKKVAAPEAAKATAKVPAPLPSANVEVARSTKTESAQSRDVPVSEIKKLPCQGFEGQPCRHVDTHTATGDWRSEYGPQPVRAGARASSATVAVFAAVAALMFGA